MSGAARHAAHVMPAATSGDDAVDKHLKARRVSGVDTVVTFGRHRTIRSLPASYPWNRTCRSEPHRHCRRELHADLIPQQPLARNAAPCKRDCDRGLGIRRRRGGRHRVRALDALSCVSFVYYQPGDNRTMQAHPTQDVVTGVLDRMEQHARTTKLAILGAVAVEGLLMVIALLKVNWADTMQLLLFIFSVLGYTIVALGLVALGAHVSRVGARVVAALDDRGRR
jgi:hypothetical protein